MDCRSSSRNGLIKNPDLQNHSISTVLEVDRSTKAVLTSNDISYIHPHYHGPLRQQQNGRSSNSSRYQKDDRQRQHFEYEWQSSAVSADIIVKTSPRTMLRSWELESKTMCVKEGYHVPAMLLLHQMLNTVYHCGLSFVIVC